jgi:uncharacterized protein YjbI with pentapeptide repeats
LKERGVDAWNAWRRPNPDLHWVDLSGADLARDLRGAILSGADLSEADLNRADLKGAILSRADLTEACVVQADLSGTDLAGTDFRRAAFAVTILSDVDLGSCKNLKLIRHLGPSIIDCRCPRSPGWAGLPARGGSRGPTVSLPRAVTAPPGGAAAPIAAGRFRRVTFDISPSGRRCRHRFKSLTNRPETRPTFDEMRFL